MNTTPNNTISTAIKRLIVSEMEKDPNDPTTLDLIDWHNEWYDDEQICTRCGHVMEFVEGCRCAGWYCHHCGRTHDADNTYY